MKYLTSIVMAFSSILALNPVYANQAEDDVRTNLQIYKLAGLADGWVETHKEKLGNLNHGGESTLSINLKARTSYKVVAVCDEDCRDLDLVLFDENNNEISRDKTTDNKPIVEVIPKWTGKFNLKVTMYNCNQNPCYFGVTVLAR